MNTDISKLMPQDGSINPKKAKTLSFYLNNIGLGLGIWLFIYPYPYKMLISIALVYPFVALYAYYKYKGIITLEDDGDPKTDQKHPTLLNAMVLPAFGITLRMIIDYDPVFFKDCIWPVVFVFIALFFIILLIQRSLSYKVQFWSKTNAPVLLFLIAFSYGSCLAINCLFDNSVPRIYRTTVLDKHYSNGKGTTYYLKLDKWGERNEPEDVSVSKSFYNETLRNQVVRVAIKKGTLNIPWFYVEQ